MKLKNSIGYSIIACGLLFSQVQANTLFCNNDCTNSVEITVSKTNVARGVSFEGGGTFTNNGLISVLSESEYAYGIFGHSNSGSYINNNKIQVETNNDTENATGLYILSYGHTSTFDNSGVLSAKMNGNLSANAYSIFLGDDTVTLNVNNTGDLLGNIGFNDTNYINLTNSGLVHLPYDANNLNGNNKSAKLETFNNESNGKLRVGLKTDGTKQGSIYSQLMATTAHFKDGSTIDVDVLASSTNVNLLVGERLDNVVKASTSLTIDGKLNITDNSALIDFGYETSNYADTADLINGEDGAIHLRVVKASENNVVDSTIKGGGNSNSQAASRALQNLYNNNPDIQSIFNNLPTDAAVADAVASIVTLTPTSNVQAGTQVASMISGIVTQRQNVNISSGGLNSGDTMFSDKNFWFKPFGSIGSQNDKDGISGFDITTGGFGLGLDGEYKDNHKLGFGLFYTNANVEVNNQPQKSDIDMFTALVYGSVPVIDDKTNFLYQTGYTWQKTDSSRTLFTGDKATADYTSNTAFVDLKLTRDVQVSDKFLLKPMVETTYRHFTNPSYKENGAGALNLHIDKFTSEDLILGIGTNAYYNITNDSKIVGNVNVGYDFKGNDQTITSSFAGAAGVKFDTKGIDNGRWSYQAGIGYELDISDRNNIHVGYEYQGQGKDFSNNIISAKYVLKF